MKNKKLLTIIISAVAALLVIGSIVVIASAARFKYELNDSGDGYVLTQYKGWKKTVNIPTTKKGLPVVGIGSEAFKGNKKLETVNIHGKIETIDVMAFADCEKLANVNMEDGVKYIGVAAFSNCTSLRSIVVPEGVEAIRTGAFNGCKALVSITLPTTLKNIHYSAFLGCTSLSGIEVDEHNTTFRSVNNCLIEIEGGILVIGTNSSVIPADGSVVTIGEGAFVDKIALRNLVIPSTISTISASAFEGCYNLTSVEMTGVESIGERAFFGCKALTTVVIGKYLRTVSDVAFHNLHRLSDIYYLGNADMFAAIEIGANNTAFDAAKLCVYSAEQPTTEGSFWHYTADNTIEKW